MRNPFKYIQKRIIEAKEGKRSNKWPSVRKEHLKNESWCRFCGEIRNLEVHHIEPFHLHPELELDDYNLITLCECIGKECHFKKGHLGNWKKFNQDIKNEAIIEAPVKYRYITKVGFFRRIWNYIDSI